MAPSIGTLATDLSTSLPIVGRENDTSKLLALPPELRNRIFEHVLAAPSSPMSISADGVIKSSEPALLRVCHQIRGETLPVFRARQAVTATRIECDVLDFDFSHLVAVIDNVTSEDMRITNHKLRKSIPSSKFRITLTLSESSEPVASAYKERLIDGLSAWLRFLGPRFAIHGHNNGNNAYNFTSDVPHVSGFEEAMSAVCAERSKGNLQACLAPMVKRSEWDKIIFAWRARRSVMKRAREAREAAERERELEREAAENKALRDREAAEEQATRERRALEESFHFGRMLGRADR